MTEIATRLSEIAEPFPALIVDQWGVMHNGYRAFPEALRALDEAKRRGKTIVTLSNSSKPRHLAKETLGHLGFEQGVHYDHIVTSGADMQDHLRDHLRAPQDDFYRHLPERPRFFILATYDGDLALLDGLPCETTRDLDEADGMIITGLQEGEKPEDFDDLLDRARVRDLPLICPNADRWVAMPDGRLHPCAALVAEAYAKKGGRIRLHGKPDEHIYHSCFRLAGRKDSGDFLAIGDSLKNDIGGAVNAKCGASVLIANGIHRAELLDGQGGVDRHKLSAFVEKTEIEPTYAMAELRW